MKERTSYEKPIWKCDQFYTRKYHAKDEESITKRVGEYNHAGNIARVDAAKLCASKTNNACEGWHRSFSELIGASHPTIWKYLEILKNEQARNETIMEQHTAGAEIPRKKKKYKNSKNSQ